MVENKRGKAEEDEFRASNDLYTYMDLKNQIFVKDIHPFLFVRKLGDHLRGHEFTGLLMIKSIRI